MNDEWNKKAMLSQGNRAMPLSILTMNDEWKKLPPDTGCSLLRIYVVYNIIVSKFKIFGTARVNKVKIAL